MWSGFGIGLELSKGVGWNRNSCFALKNIIGCLVLYFLFHLNSNFLVKIIVQGCFATQ